MDSLTRTSSAKDTEDLTRLAKDFKFFSGPVKAFTKSEDGKKTLYVEGVASSTVQDRQGDQINRAAVMKMAETAQGITLFLNHSYNVPEDVFGVCTTVGLEPAQDKQQGPCTDMHVTVRVEDSNPRAMACWTAINNGTRLAFSIGGNLGGYVLRDPKPGEDPGPFMYEGKVMEITDLKLYEISLVGIPANQRSYVEDALAKAVRKRLEASLVQPTDTNLIPKVDDPSLTPAQKALVIANADNEAAKTAVLARREGEPDPTLTGADLEHAEAVDAEEIELAAEPEVAKARSPHLLDAIGHGRAAADHGNLCEKCAPEMQSALGVMNKCYDSGKDMSEANVNKCMALVGGAMAHGQGCGVEDPCVGKCFTSLKNLLPPGYEGDPADPTPSAENPTDEIQVPGGVDNPMPHALEAEVPLVGALALESTMADQLVAIYGKPLDQEFVDACASVLACKEKDLARVSEEQAKADALTAITEAKAKEVADLEAKLAKLNATRTGRSTKVLTGSLEGQAKNKGEAIDKDALAEKRRASMNANTKSEIAEAMAGTVVDDPRLRSDA